jgi:hypothetical protein
LLAVAGRLGADHQEGAVQITADLGGLRDRERARIRCQRLEQILDDVRVGEVLDQLPALDRHGCQVRYRTRQLLVLAAELASGRRSRTQQPQPLAPSGEGGDEHVGNVQPRPQAPRGRARALTVEGIDQQPRGRDRRRRRQRGGVRCQQVEAAVGVEAVDLAELGVEQLAGPAGHYQPQVAGVGHGCHFAAEAGEAPESVDAPALLLVELGVLERARDE